MDWLVSYPDALCHVTKNKDLLEYIAIQYIQYVLSTQALDGGVYSTPAGALSDAHHLRTPIEGEAALLFRTLQLIIITILNKSLVALHCLSRFIEVHLGPFSYLFIIACRV